MIKSKFGKARERILKNYDYFDVASGTGVQLFYGTVTSGAITASGALVTGSVYSTPVATVNSVTDNNGVRTLTFDKDFDVEFNRPQIISGPGIINVPHAITGGAADKTYTAQMQIYIKKYDGSTETNLAQGSGAILAKASTATAQERMSSVMVDIPRTLFKSGETLRLTIEGWYSAQAGASAANFAVGHDPQNGTDSNFTNVDRKLIFPVPFRLDL